jgi:asparagine synthase (glutamine-hydrolysing)
LISDVPVGLLLSGGIDSSLVGAAYSGLPGAQIPSFTMGFDDPDSDERPYALAVAQALKLRHEDFVVDTKDVVAEFEGLWSSFDEPFADSSALPTLVLCREIRKRVKVVIGGDGGDEVWCGYPWHRAMSKLDRVMWVPRVIRCALAAVMSFAGAKWRYFARVISARDRLEAWTVLKTGLTEKTARFLPVDAEPRPLTDCQAGATKRVGSVSDTLDWACRMDLASYLPDDLLVKADRASMAVGLELREPLLDAEFTTAALQLPSSVRFEKETGQGKRFARRFLADFLPADLINRPKRGFTPPLDVWLLGPLKEVRDRAIQELEAGKLYPVKLPKGVATWDECSRRLDDTQQQFLWRIICFSGWKAARLGN